MMYKTQFKKNYPSDWFCDPASQMFTLTASTFYVCSQHSTNVSPYLWSSKHVWFICSVLKGLLMRKDTKRAADLTWDSTNSRCERSMSSWGVTLSSWMGSHHFCGAALSTITNRPCQSVIAQAKYWPSRKSRISQTTAGTKLDRDTVLLHQVSHLHPWMIIMSAKAMMAGMMKKAEENSPFQAGLHGHSNSSSTSFSSPIRMKPKATLDTRGLLLSSFFSLVSHCCRLPILTTPESQRRAGQIPPTHLQKVTDARRIDPGASFPPSWPYVPIGSEQRWACRSSALGCGSLARGGRQVWLQF